METETKQIFSKIYQDLKEEMTNNNENTFLKEYTIPSINYNPDSENRDNMHFASGIEMELYQMMKQFDYKVYFSSYKDKYFFSNDLKLVQEKMLKELEKENERGGNKMEKTEELKEKLFEKLETELEDFEQKLKQKTVDEILESAYELTVKREIIGEIKEKNLDEDELKALLKEDNLLSEFYEDWRNSDGRLGEEISYTMDDTIDIVVKEYEKEKNIKNKESR